MWSPLHGNLSESVAWHPEPDYRGTFGILSSCLSTMFLCIWTVVHLNIPEFGKESHQKWHRLGWLILGLLAPEIVAFHAYVQYKVAATSTTMIRETLNIAKPLPPRPKLTECVHHLVRDKKAHDHSVVELGELENGVYNSSSPISSDESSESNPRSRRTQNLDLSAPAYDALWRAPSNPELNVTASNRLNPGSLEANQKPSTNTASIRKDVSGPLTSWTIQQSFYVLMGGFTIPVTQSGGGAASSSPRITLTILGFLWLVRHVPDTLPDTTQNEIVDKSKADALVKLLAVIQALWFCLQCVTRFAQGLPITLLEIHVLGHTISAVLIYMVWWSKPFDVKYATLLKGEKIESIVALLRLYNAQDSDDKETSLDIEQWTPSLSRTPTGPKKDQLDLPIEKNERVFDFTYIGTEAKVLRPAEIEQLRAASRALGMVDLRELKPGTPYLQPRVKNFAPSSCNFLLSFFNSESNKVLAATWASVTATCAAFGALHLLSWFAPFHKPMEMQLWRISAVAVTCTGPALSCLTFSNTILSRLLKLLYERKQLCSELRRPEWLRNQWPCDFFLVIWSMITIFFVSSVTWLITFSIAFGRTFLIVECFINLAYIPESALATPKWSRYVPHLS